MPNPEPVRKISMKRDRETKGCVVFSDPTARATVLYMDKPVEDDLNSIEVLVYKA